MSLGALAARKGLWGQPASSASTGVQLKEVTFLNNDTNLATFHLWEHMLYRF